MKHDDGGPAFPALDASLVGGMSLRDYFAAAALYGATGLVGLAGVEAKLIVQFAYQLADAMLAERAKERPE